MCTVEGKVAIRFARAAKCRLIPEGERAAPEWRRTGISNARDEPTASASCDGVACRDNRANRRRLGTLHLGVGVAEWDDHCRHSITTAMKRFTTRKTPTKMKLPK